MYEFDAAFVILRHVVSVFVCMSIRLRMFMLCASFCIATFCLNDGAPVYSRVYVYMCMYVRLMRL